VRSTVPLRHKLIAVVVAAAAACGLYASLLYREAQLASAASLSFDFAAAQQLDSSVARTPHPAVVLGQSILSDSFVATLILHADLAAPSAAHAVGEFRTRIELTQPSAGFLWVRYRDPDPGQAVATANAVAKALAGWTPSTTSTRAPAAPASAAAPQDAPPAEASPAAAPLPVPAAGPSLVTALGELQALLSAADQRADPESSLQTERDRQRYLESQVRDAQQKLDDLRNEFPQSDSASGGQVHLDAIQHALALFWPSTAGLNAAGTSEEQLDYERDQLTRDMNVIAQQRQAAQRAGTANAASVNQPATAADAPSPFAASATGNPLHLERLARLPTQLAQWPSALIGFFCGLLYLGLAFACYHSSAESDDLLDLPEARGTSIYRLFEADARVPADSDEVPVDAVAVKTPSRKRAFLTLDLGSIPAPVPDQPPSPEPIQGSTADTALDSLAETAPVSTHTEMAEAASAAEAVAPLRAPEQQDEVSPEEVIGTGDSWEEGIRNRLSQTDFARMLNSQIVAENVGAAKGPNRDEGPPLSETDRLAG
jgi:hypothetical protein